MEGRTVELDGAELLIGWENAVLPGCDPDTGRALERLIGAHLASAVVVAPAAPVSLHGDLHLGNLVLDHPTGTVTGIWDFTCVEWGDPAHDLRYLPEAEADLGVLVAQCYAELTGRSLDVEGVRLVGALEEVTDAIAEGRPLAELVASWPATPDRPH